MAVAAAPTVTGVSGGNIQLSNGSIYPGANAAPVGQAGPAGPAGSTIPGGVTQPDGSVVQPPAGTTPTPAKPLTQLQIDQNNLNAALGAPTPTAGVDMSSYITAFNNSYNEQMANIKAGLTASLGQVQTRRDQAAGIVDKMPAQLNSNYADVTANEQAMQQQDSAGLGARAQADAAGAQQRGNAVLQENRAADKGTGDYMNLGITANQQADEATLNASANNAEAAAAQQRDSEAQAAMQVQASTAAANAQLAEDARNQKTQFLESKYSADQATAQTNATQPALNPALAQMGFTEQQVKTAQADPAYKWFENQIATNDSQSNKEYLLWMTKQPGNEVLGPLIVQQNPDFFKGVKSVTGTSHASWGLPTSFGDYMTRRIVGT